MKIGAASVVKNEEDVIELFLRHNLNLVDAIHIVDHCSGDNTVEIIKRLMSEGLPITISSSNHKSWHQGQAMTEACLRQASQHDYIVPLDADEFLMSPSRKEFEADLKTIPVGQVGLVNWKTFLLGDVSDLNFVKYARRRRKNEHVPYGKVIVPSAHLLNGGTLVRGSHYAHDPDGGRVPMVDLKTALGHFPVRSSMQMVSKSVLGAHGFQMCVEATVDHASHWHEMANMIRSWDYTVTPKQIDDLAMNYCNHEPRPDCDIALDTIPRFDNVEIRYPDLICSNLLRRFDQFISTTVQKITQAKQIASIIGGL